MENAISLKNIECVHGLDSANSMARFYLVDGS